MKPEKRWNTLYISSFSGKVRRKIRRQEVRGDLFSVSLLIAWENDSILCRRNQEKSAPTLVRVPFLCYYCFTGHG
jgi:hypothetical protein